MRKQSHITLLCSREKKVVKIISGSKGLRGQIAGERIISFSFLSGMGSPYQPASVAAGQVL
jgi:hypothetical protein